MKPFHTMRTITAAARRRRWLSCLVAGTLVAGTLVAGTLGGFLVASSVATAAPTQGTNPAPRVLPSLRQWTGGTGSFSLGQPSRVIVDQAHLADLRPDAVTFANDLASITGRRLPVAVGTGAKPGEIFLTTGDTDVAAQGYTLDIAAAVTISGADPTGTFYGEQTVEQILRLDPQHTAMPQGRAVDWPDYAQRGFLLDPARHYYSPDYILHQIRTAAWEKLDTIHLHLTDDNAFRLQSTTYPGLAAAQSYSHADIVRMVDYAHRYHVTLVPEIEMPAHSLMQTYDTSLAWSCASMGSTVDVTKPETTTFVTNLLKEFVPLFKYSPVIHLGGDEYPGLAAQQQCPELVSYAKDHGLASTEDVIVSWQNQLADVVTALGRRPEIWNWWDVAGGATIAPSKTFIIESWTGSNAPYLDAGYDVMSTPSSLLYVVPCGVPGTGYFPNDPSLYASWQPDRNPRLMGYEVSRWGDCASAQTTDTYYDWFGERPQQVLATRTWGGPRAADVFTFEDQVDQIGPPPEVPSAVPGEASLLTGTPYGSAAGAGAAFDGDPSTSYSDPSGTPGYVGIDLGAGNAQRVTKVRFVTAANQQLQMVGGQIQGCTDGPAQGCHTLATVTWRPPYDWKQLPVFDHGRYRWLRYLGPTGTHAPIAELQFYTAPATAGQITVDAPDTLAALGANTVTTTFTNTTNAPLSNLQLSLTATSEQTTAPLNTKTDDDTVLASVPAHSSVRTAWQVDVPADTPAQAYDVLAHATYQNPDPQDPGAQVVGDTSDAATTTVPQLLKASLQPATVLTPDGSPVTTSLRVSSTAGRTLTLRWAAAVPTQSALTLTPSSGTLTLPPHGSDTTTITVTGGNRPGVLAVPIHLQIVSTPGNVTVDGPTLGVSVPCPNLAACYNNIGVTNDDDINPPGFGDGFADTTSFSAQELATHGITPGATLPTDGVTFTWPDVPAGQPDNVLADGQTVDVSGSGSTLGLLTSATYGPVTGTGTITYTDGTTQPFTLNVADWTAGGPTTVMASSYHNWVGHGQNSNYVSHIYANEIPLRPGKTVQSVTLPAVSDHTTGGTPSLHVFGIAIGGPADTNILTSGTATASSVVQDLPQFQAKYVNDGDPTTRWASGEGPGYENSWVQVQLPTPATIRTVVLSWENAYATQYKIQVSTDGTQWTDAATITNGHGGIDYIPINAGGPVSYVRMQGVTPFNPAWDYSLWEMKAFP
ncbi:MAG: family 20 glycosylhydrolase [Acidimicrobiaceae bacterium]|nr:family 20 glycosylhydrolase [Acidimicrobiaceae bacterium]